MYGYKGWLVVGALAGISYIATGGFSGITHRKTDWWNTPPASSQVEIVQSVRPYEIFGNSSQELTDYMSAHGPGEEEDHSWAWTEWNIDWKFRFEETFSQCSLRDSSIGVRIRITQNLPRWKNYAAAPAELQRQWQIFNRALMANEDEQARTGIETAQKVLETLRAMPAQPTCEELDARIRIDGALFNNSGLRQEVAFQAQTNHGMNDFALLP